MNFLKIIVLHMYEPWVNFMARKLHLNKAVKMTSFFVVYNTFQKKLVFLLLF